MPNSHPIDAEIAGPVIGGNNFMLTVTLDQAPASALTIALNTSSSVVTGPNGTAFPATAVVFAGHTSVDVPLGSVAPPTDISATLTATANGGSASGTVMIQRPPPGGG